MGKRGVATIQIPIYNIPYTIMSRRFLAALITFIAIVVATGIAVLITKGYRISPEKGTITGTGILSVNSEPDQASVYLDGHLTTATNANINSLIPKSYDLKIIKEGYITWEKKVEVKEGLVTQIKATLFRTIPTVYPITYTGAQMAQPSADSQKLLYVVPLLDPNDPISAKKAGVWVWQMSERQLNLGRGNEPRQISASNGIDWTKGEYRWSPDSTQVLVKFPDRYLLLDIDRFNDPPRDVTLQVNATLKNWDETEKTRNVTRINAIKNFNLKKIASDSAFLKWSPDETKFLYSKDGQEDFNVADLSVSKTYQVPKVLTYLWLADSDHLVLVDTQPQTSSSPKPSPQASPTPLVLPSSRISIIEYDGFNRSEIYVGSLDPKSIFPWPDGSRLIVVSSFPTANTSSPNLFGINLK